MDHFKCLDRFRIGKAPLLRIPYLGFGHGEHPPCAFKDYPLVYGWTSEQLSRLRIDGPTSSGLPAPIQALAMLQCWLFAGAIEAIVGVRIQTDEFVHTSKKGPLVSTVFLPETLYSWQKLANECSWEEKRKIFGEVGAVLAEMQFWCFNISRWSTSLSKEGFLLTSASTREVEEWSASTWNNYEFNLDRLTQLITLVGEAVAAARSSLIISHVDVAASMKRGGFMGRYTYSAQSKLVGALIRRGWCPFMASVLMKYRYSIAEFATWWPATGNKVDAHEQHKDCSLEGCVAYNIDSATYRNRHMKPSCQCENIVPPEADVKAILGCGGIPVMGVVSNSGSRLSQDVWRNETVKFVVRNAAEIEDEGGYLAISHVWFDGMGSDTETGLPGCVVRKLFSRAEALDHRYIWIDALCVPAEKRFRKAAIMKMASTYERATKTLVVDRTIGGVAFSQDVTRIEVVLLMLVTAPWMQRLWTLQEALLSDALVFEFNNTLASTYEIFKIIFLSVRQQGGPNAILQSLSNEFRKIVKPKPQTDHAPAHLEIGDVQRLLTLRRTSKIEDETIAVAGLLGVSTEELQTSLNAEGRMRKLFELVKWLPNDIVLLDKPRMTELKWRWAIKSFLPSNNEETSVAERLMGLTSGPRAERVECLENGGLRGEYSVIQLSRAAVISGVECVLVKLPDNRLLRAGASSSQLPEEPYTFDTVIMVPWLGNISELKVGAALLSVRRADGSVYEEPQFVYQKRFLVRLIVADGSYTNRLQETVVDGNMQVMRIVIL